MTLDGDAQLRCGGAPDRGCGLSLAFKQRGLSVRPVVSV